MKSFLLAGHVDHGKSTLCGRLLVNYGNLDIHQLIKLKKDCPKSYLNRILDIYEEERERNKTFEWSSIILNNEIELIDTPGHKIFIREFIQALTTNKIDSILFCISGKRNEFSSGFEESQEFIKLIRSCNIKKFIIIWTKSPPEEEDRERLKIFLKNTRTDFVEFYVDSVENTGINDLWRYINLYDSLDIETISLFQPRIGKYAKGIAVFLMEGLYCRGFTGVSHLMNGSEAEFTIERFEIGKNKKYVINSKDNSKVGIIISFDKEIEITERIILRSNGNQTIGYVVVKFTK